MGRSWSLILLLAGVAAENCSSTATALVQRQLHQWFTFTPGEDPKVAREEVEGLQKLLSPNASIFHSDNMSALEEANDQLYCLLPLVRQIPSMLVHVATEQDMVEVLRFCRSHRLRPVLVATGHDWNGRSSGAGAVRIATPRLCWVDVEGDRARVGAGCPWGHVNEVLEPLGRMAVTGAVPSVSISGSLQGGGHGGLSRQHGLIADQLLSARVALANGSGVVVADAAGPHADLFRALRGGGGGTYGAVVEFTVRIHPLPKSYARSQVLLPLRGSPNARTVTERFFHNASWWAEVPDSWSGWHEVNVQRRGEDWEAYFIAWLFHWGQHPEEACLSNGCPAAMSEYFNFLGRWPEQGGLQYWLPSHWRHGDVSSRQKSFITNSFVSMADLRDKDKASKLTDLVINSTLAALERKQALHWTYNDVLGGQIPHHGQDTVVSPGFRDAIFEVCVGKEWNNEDNEEQVNQLMPLVAELYSLELGSNMSYYNEVTHWPGLHDVSDWRHRFWGDDAYKFLHEVKQAYDPCHILWVDRGVGSEDPKMIC